MNNDNPGSGQHGFSIRRLLDRIHPNPENGHNLFVIVGSAAVIVLAINLALVVWALTPKETPGVIPPEKTDRGIVSAPPATPLKHDEISGLPAITSAVTHGTPDCAYVEVAFATRLETDDLERYASIGLDLYDRIDSHTWYACLMGNADEFAKAHQEIDRIEVIQAESKIAEQLKLDRTPLEHERRTGGRVAYSVLFHKDVDFQQAQSMADSMRFELENVEGGLFNTLGAATVIVPEGRLPALAAVAIIARIEPIDTPEAPTNQGRGQPLSKVDKVQEDPIGLDGSGVTVGVWEAGGTVLAEHLDLTGRVIIEPGQTSRKSGHATHVAGTIGSSGTYIPAAEGMAPNSQITSWDSRSDHQEMLLSGNSINSDEEPNPVFISNHSYGLCTGWNGCTRGWLPNHNFGAYTIHASVLDRVIAESGVISTWSAGNSQNYGPSGNTDPDRPNNCTAHQYDEFQHAPDVFADCINAENGAKNVITVAAMRNAGSVASFSSYGPMDDGRIKPDLAAQGNPLLSTVPGGQGQVCVGPNGGAPCASAYSGTSMSSPLVAGVAALVMQDVLEQADDPFKRIATRMTPEGMKALLIQTAQDVSGFDQANPGPDYATGWGIVDAEAAIGLLRKGGLVQGGLEDTGLAGAWTQPMVVPPGQPEIHVTLAWTDPPGNPAAEKALVNDLDLRLISPDGTEFTPWVLAGMADPTRPAVRNGGNDSINNVEQVSVLSPKPGDWQVVVKADRGNMPSPQNFAVAGVLPIEPGTLVSPIRTAPSAGPVRIGTPPTPSLACPMDDTEIVFNKISESGNDLWKVNSDCEYTQLTDTAAAGEGDGAWSPDGRKIAFVSERDGNSEIYVMNADGSAQTRLTFDDGEDRFPTWSPDGKKIVFTSPRIGGPGTYDIHVLEVAKPNNADNQYPPKALTQAGSSNAPMLINGSPDWSPDGDRIAFTSTRDGDYELYLMDTDGGNVTRITDNEHTDYLPQWSPDGKKIVFTVEKEESQSVWVVGSDGNDLRRLTDDESNNGTASWSPDGKHITFASDRDGSTKLYMMDADGSNVRRMTQARQ